MNKTEIEIQDIRIKLDRIINMMQDGFNDIFTRFTETNIEIRKVKKDVKHLKTDVGHLKKDVRILKNDMTDVKIRLEHVAPRFRPQELTSRIRAIEKHLDLPAKA